MVVRQGHVGRALAIVLVCGAIAACSRGDAEPQQREARRQQPAPQPARIVHAVASDLFPAGAPVDDRAAGVQALKSLLDWIASGEDVEADALVLVGDLGLSAPATAPAPTPPPTLPPAPTPTPTTPTPTPTPAPAPTPTPAQTPASADTAARAKVIASVLGAATRSVPIYLVPGGRRLTAPAELKAALTALHSAVDEVRKALPSGSITLVDLSRCYVATTPDPSQCTARLPGRRVKVVAYPAFAFTGAPPAASLTEQQNWIQTFEKAMAVQEEGWQTLVIAPLHTPAVDHWSSATVRTSWLQAANRAAAGIGIIAPSMVRQRYEDDEPWTEDGLEGRWFATPPLVTASAGNRPIQGASVFSVGQDSVDQQVFWYAPAAAAFRTVAAELGNDEENTWFRRWIRRPLWFLWRLGSLSPLARSSLFAVAFLAALLTAVAVWQIPPASTTLTPPSPPSTPAAGGASAPAAGATPSSAPAAPGVAALATTTFLSGNFARTVVSGLGGLAIAMLILDALWTNSKADAQGYYVVWFVLFFVVFLWCSSVARGLIEGLRAVIVATPPPHVINVTANRWFDRLGWSAITAWAKRFLRRFWWFLVVAADTTFNVAQGQNDVKPFVLGKTIVDLQLASLMTIDRVRESLTVALEQLIKKHLQQTPAAGEIRVSVSVLADDEKQTFYVSKPSQNLSTQFGPKSVAWVAVMIGQARWWVKHPDYTDIELFDNTGQVLPSPHPAAKMVMSDYFQERKADYEAFIVIPIPLRQRGSVPRRAGLHISFGKKAYMELVWPNFTNDPYGMPTAHWKQLPVPRPPAYPKANDILAETNDELRALLKQSIDVIEAALREFNELLFWNEPRLHRRS